MSGLESLWRSQGSHPWETICKTEICSVELRKSLISLTPQFHGAGWDHGSQFHQHLCCLYGNRTIKGAWPSQCHTEASGGIPRLAPALVTASTALGHLLPGKAQNLWQLLPFVRQKWPSGLRASKGRTQVVRPPALICQQVTPQPQPPRISPSGCPLLLIYTFLLLT